MTKTAAKATPMFVGTAASPAEFRASLDASLAATAAKATPAAKPDAAQANLEARLTDALNRGVPLDRVVDALSTQLANQIAAAAGQTSPDAIAHIKAVVATALAPPANGPAPPAIPTAATLAANARRIVEAASRAGIGPPDPRAATQGEPSRRLAGNPSDTVPAVRGNPAPRPDTSSDQNAAVTTATLDVSLVLHGAASAVAALPPVATDPIAPASGVPAPDVTAATPAVPATDLTLALVPNATPTPTPSLPAPSATGDGKRVAVDPASLVATGGDTVLGRTLARAFRAQPEAPSAAAPVLASLASASKAGTSPGSLAGDALASLMSRLTEAFASEGLSVAPAGSPSSSHDDGSGIAGDGAAAGSSGPALLPAATGSPDPAFANLVGTVAQTADAQPIVPAPPVPSAAAPQPPVDPSALAEQLVRGAFIPATADGSSEIRLRLVPEHLGDVQVKLVVNGGDVSASVLATTADARDALAAGQATLTKTLADAGLKLTSFNVDYGPPTGGFSNDQRSSQDQRPPGRRLAYLGGDAGDDAGESVTAVTTPASPMLGGLGIGLNYYV